MNRNASSYRIYQCSNESKSSHENNDQNNDDKGKKLAQKSFEGQEPSSKKHQKTQLHHIEFRNTGNFYIHPIQSASHVRMTIIAANIVHPSPIDAVGVSDRAIPLFRAACGGLQSERGRGRLFGASVPGREVMSAFKARVGDPNAIRPWSPTLYGP